MSYGSSFISLSTDEAHNLSSTKLVLVTSNHRVLVKLQGKIHDQHYHNLHFCNHLIIMYRSNHLILAPSNSTWLWKTITLRMRIWPARLSPLAFFSSLFSRSDPFPLIWSWNCPLTSPSMREPTNVSFNNLCLSYSHSSLTYPGINLRMNSRGTWMSRIDS